MIQFEICQRKLMVQFRVRIGSNRGAVRSGFTGGGDQINFPSPNVKLDF